MWATRWQQISEPVLDNKTCTSELSRAGFLLGWLSPRQGLSLSLLPPLLSDTLLLKCKQFLLKCFQYPHQTSPTLRWGFSSPHPLWKVHNALLAKRSMEWSETCFVKALLRSWGDSAEHSAGWVPSSGLSLLSPAPWLSELQQWLSPLSRAPLSLFSLLSVGWFLSLSCCSHTVVLQF